MIVKIRTFLVRDTDTGEVMIFGSTINSDDENRDDLGEHWTDSRNDQHAFVEIEVDLPEPTPIPVFKAAASAE